MHRMLQSSGGKSAVSVDATQAKEVLLQVLYVPAKVKSVPRRLSNAPRKRQNA